MINKNRIDDKEVRAVGGKTELQLYGQVKHRKKEKGRSPRAVACLRHELAAQPHADKIHDWLRSQGCSKSGPGGHKRPARLLRLNNIFYRVIEVSTEQRRNVRAGEKGDPRENPPTTTASSGTIPTCENPVRPGRGLNPDRNDKEGRGRANSPPTQFPSRRLRRSLHSPEGGAPTTAARHGTALHATLLSHGRRQVHVDLHLAALLRRDAATAPHLGDIPPRSTPAVRTSPSKHSRVRQTTVCLCRIIWLHCKPQQTDTNCVQMKYLDPAVPRRKPQLSRNCVERGNHHVATHPYESKIVILAKQPKILRETSRSQGVFQRQSRGRVHILGKEGCIFAEMAPPFVVQAILGGTDSFFNFTDIDPHSPAHFIVNSLHGLSSRDLPPSSPKEACERSCFSSLSAQDATLQAHMDSTMLLVATLLLLLTPALSCQLLQVRADCSLILLLLALASTQTRGDLLRSHQRSNKGEEKGLVCIAKKWSASQMLKSRSALLVVRGTIMHEKGAGDDEARQASTEQPALPATHTRRLSRESGGNGRSLRKPTDQRHRPARFLHEKIRERPRRESNPVRLGGRRDECESGDDGKYPFLNAIVDGDEQWSDIGEQSFADKVRVKRDPTISGDALQGDDRAKVRYDQPAHTDPAEYEYDVAQAHQHEDIPLFHIESGRQASKNNTGTKSAELADSESSRNLKNNYDEKLLESKEHSKLLQTVPPFWSSRQEERQGLKHQANKDLPSKYPQSNFKYKTYSENIGNIPYPRRKCLPTKLAYHPELEATIMQRTPKLKPLPQFVPLPKLPQIQEPILQPQPLIPQSKQSIPQPEPQPYMAQPEPKQYMAKPELVHSMPQPESVQYIPQQQPVIPQQQPVRSIAQLEFLRSVVQQPVHAIPQPEPVHSVPQPEPEQYIPQSHAQQHISLSHQDELMADQTLPQPQQLIPLSKSRRNPITILHTFKEPLQQITLTQQSEGALEQLVLPPLDFTQPEEADGQSEDYLRGRLACDVVERILRHVQSAGDTRHHVRPGLPARTCPRLREGETRHTDVDQMLHSILEDTLRKLSSLEAAGSGSRLPDSLGAFLPWLLLASRDSSHEPHDYSEVAYKVRLLERLLSHHDALGPREQAVVRAEHDVIARLYQRLAIYTRSLTTTRVKRKRPPQNFKMRHVWDEEPGRSRQSKMPQRTILAHLARQKNDSNALKQTPGTDMKENVLEEWFDQHSGAKDSERKAQAYANSYIPVHFGEFNRLLVDRAAGERLQAASVVDVVQAASKEVPGLNPGVGIPESVTSRRGRNAEAANEGDHDTGNAPSRACGRKDDLA
ncbi:hypothetical protein PR048_017437 [Dryococelus australis]|uniref:Uncharacterized protein n=1 Tax=Dryococelus australis TaxID=614101 RepID=A0ABQ9H9K5_9NEOP|nr:hypothetical protein PR048_017437 [Dryococelus australis]